LQYQGLKHYFLIEFSQKSGALRQFLDRALSSNEDITLFEYVKKNNREFGPALVGIELNSKEHLDPLLARLTQMGIRYELLKSDSYLFQFLV